MAPEWQGQGLGTALQTRLQEYAMARGVKGFIAEILASNLRMVRLAANAPGVATTAHDEDTVQVTILFSDRADAKPPKPDADAGNKPSKVPAKRKARRSSK